MRPHIVDCVAGVLDLVAEKRELAFVLSEKGGMFDGRLDSM
jgi:hypothetical protein